MAGQGEGRLKKNINLHFVHIAHLLCIHTPPMPTPSSTHAPSLQTNASLDFRQVLHSMRDPIHGSARSSLAQDLLDISLHPRHSREQQPLPSPASFLPCTNPIVPHTCSHLWYFDN